MQQVNSAGVLLMMACWKNCLKFFEDWACQKTHLKMVYREKIVLKTSGEFALGTPPLLVLRFSERTAAAGEVEKWWTREKCVPGAVVSGHGPTHFAADELGNHGNAHTDAGNISCFARAKEGM